LSNLAKSLGWTGTGTISEMYIALVFFSAILVSASLAGGQETGILKFYLSLPASRLRVVSAKFLASYAIVYLISLGSTYYRMFMIAPDDFVFLLINSPFHILQPSLFLGLTILFTFSVALYFSVVTASAWQASLFALITLYSTYTTVLVVPGLHWFFPPFSFAHGFFQITNMLYITFFSVMLVSLSFFLFTKKLEVT
jgi:ABC-type transport system involved in multi-copper enzyme maturation permease subunit